MCVSGRKEGWDARVDEDIYIYIYINREKDIPSIMRYYNNTSIELSNGITESINRFNIEIIRRFIKEKNVRPL
jgi:hypothetical protein